jgi:hypothetical protein
MGIFGWNVLSPSMRLVGTLQSHHYSGGGGIVSTSDYDSNLVVVPAAGYTHLATNSAGVANPGGVIDCEIHVARDIPDTPVEGQLFDPCVGKNVTITGVHVEDRSHDNKTEIHPVDSMLADLGADGAGHHFRFCAFSDDWTWIFSQPTPPPFAGEDRVADALIPFPAPEQPGSIPVYKADAQRLSAPQSVDLKVLTVGDQTYLHVLVHTGTTDKEGLYWADLTLFWQPPK